MNATRVNYPAFIMDFWFNKNLRVSQAPAPVMASCSASVLGPGPTLTVNGAASFAQGTVASYRVLLDGPLPVDDHVAGSGPAFSKAYPNRADGSYGGSVWAAGSSGQTSSACAIPAFQVGTGSPPPVFTCTTTSASNYAHVQAGRAHASGGYALANGSDQNLGLYTPSSPARWRRRRRATTSWGVVRSAGARPGVRAYAVSSGARVARANIGATSRPSS